MFSERMNSHTATLGIILRLVPCAFASRGTLNVGLIDDLGQEFWKCNFPIRVDDHSGRMTATGSSSETFTTVAVFGFPCDIEMTSPSCIK